MFCNKIDFISFNSYYFILYIHNYIYSGTSNSSHHLGPIFSGRYREVAAVGSFFYKRLIGSGPFATGRCREVAAVGSFFIRD